MSDFDQLRVIFPFLKPKAANESLRQWLERHEDPKKNQLNIRLWSDHLASVADYWEHKRLHPNSRAGAMVILYSWAPVVTVVCSVLTLNPIGVFQAVEAYRRFERYYKGRKEK